MSSRSAPACCRRCLLPICPDWSVAADAAAPMGHAGPRCEDVSPACVSSSLFSCCMRLHLYVWVRHDHAPCCPLVTSFEETGRPCIEPFAMCLHGGAATRHGVHSTVMIDVFRYDICGFRANRKREKYTLQTMSNQLGGYFLSAPLSGPFLQVSSACAASDRNAYAAFTQMIRVRRWYQRLRYVQRSGGSRQGGICCPAAGLNLPGDPVKPYPHWCVLTLSASGKLPNYIVLSTAISSQLQSILQPGRQTFNYSTPDTRAMRSPSSTYTSAFMCTCPGMWRPVHDQLGAVCHNLLNQQPHDQAAAAAIRSWHHAVCQLLLRTHSSPMRCSTSALLYPRG